MFFKIKSPIHKRVIATSAVIIFFFTLSLGFVIHLLYKQNYFALYAAELVTTVPRIIAELKRDDDLNIQQYFQQKNDNQLNIKQSPSKYMAFICKKTQLVWASKQADQNQFEQICYFFPQDTPEPELLYYHQRPYVVYKITNPSIPSKFDFFIIREVSEQLDQFSEIKQKTWLYLTLLFFITTALIYIASYWSFHPLRQLVDELNEISASKREKLSNNYPTELEGVTEALNRMISLQQQQSKRYSNAMDDLAHSLKTRLAATNIILFENQLPQEIMCQKIVEQISQMDDVVQYQLKRALIGQKGLVTTHTQLGPTIESLLGMFTKIYRDKPVYLDIQIDHAQFIPLTKPDSTEILGNILENAFRFCIEKIRIRTYANGQEIILLIEDDGPGVPLDFRESIFQRGVRADQLNPGTGIGLAVSSDIVENYGGSIYVRESSLEGAAFIIRFPISRQKNIMFE